MRRLLITGAGGYLGSMLVRRAAAGPAHWDLHGTFLTHTPNLAPDRIHRLEVRDELAVRALVGRLRPHVVIHTSSIMGPDAYDPPAETGETFEVNSAGTRNIARACAQVGARLLHLSTDVVFDGSQAPYAEDAPVNPLHRYGLSKVVSEREVAASGAMAAIVRTSLIYGFKPLDPRTQAILDGKMVRLFTDELRSPVWVRDLADALLELAAGDYQGVLHVAGPEGLDRYAFGVKLARALGGRLESLVPALTRESPILRPRDCRLDVSRAARLLRTRLHTVDEALALRKVPSEEDV